MILNKPSPVPLATPLLLGLAQKNVSSYSFFFFAPYCWCFLLRLLKRLKLSHSYHIHLPLSLSLTILLKFPFSLLSQTSQRIIYTISSSLFLPSHSSTCHYLVSSFSASFLESLSDPLLAQHAKCQTLLMHQTRTDHHSFPKPCSLVPTTVFFFVSFLVLWHTTFPVFPSPSSLPSPCIPSQ